MVKPLGHRISKTSNHYHHGHGQGESGIFKKATPRLLESAEGMYFTAHDGRQVLDGTAGLWCCNAGHARPRIVKAIQEQAATLDFAPTFQMGHPLPFRLAAALSEFAPPGLDRIFFSDDGSTAERRPGEPEEKLRVGLSCK